MALSFFLLVVPRGAFVSKAGHSNPQATSLQSEVTEVEKELTLRCLLWESLQEWQGLVDQWEATPFETLKIDDVQQDVARFIQTVFLLEKGTFFFIYRYMLFCGLHCKFKPILLSLYCVLGKAPCPMLHTSTQICEWVLQTVINL